MVAGPGVAGPVVTRGTAVAHDADMPGTSVPADNRTEAPGAEPGPRRPEDGRLPVSELIADRAAAPSPFGDDQTFPLPVERLTYTPTLTP
jgi:hypothetical protein